MEDFKEGKEDKKRGSRSEGRVKKMGNYIRIRYLRPGVGKVGSCHVRFGCTPRQDNR